MYLKTTGIYTSNKKTLAFLVSFTWLMICEPSTNQYNLIACLCFQWDCKLPKGQKKALFIPSPASTGFIEI